MTKEPRNIPATNAHGAKATLTASQVEAWEAAGWSIDKPKATKSAAQSKKTTRKK